MESPVLWRPSGFHSHVVSAFRRTRGGGFGPLAAGALPLGLAMIALTALESLAQVGRIFFSGGLALLSFTFLWHLFRRPGPIAEITVSTDMWLKAVCLSVCAHEAGEFEVQMMGDTPDGGSSIPLYPSPQPVPWIKESARVCRLTKGSTARAELAFYSIEYPQQPESADHTGPHFKFNVGAKWDPAGWMFQYAEGGGDGKPSEKTPSFQRYLFLRVTSDKADPIYLGVALSATRVPGVKGTTRPVLASHFFRIDPNNPQTPHVLGPGTEVESFPRAEGEDP